MTEEVAGSDADVLWAESPTQFVQTEFGPRPPGLVIGHEGGC